MPFSAAHFFMRRALQKSRQQKFSQRLKTKRRGQIEMLDSRRLLAADSFPQFGGELLYQPLDAARAADAVANITTSASPALVFTQDDDFKETGDDSSGDFQVNLINSTLRIKLDQFRAAPQFAGIDGSGFSAVVLDTGIDLNHPHFGPDSNSDGIADRIVYQESFVGAANADDGNGHGTHVSGILGSQDSNLKGMAPAASLISLQTNDAQGQGTFEGLEQALQWVVANAQTYNIASVNMSLSDGGNYAEAISQYGIGDELAALAALDVIVVSASGNSYPSYQTVGVGYPSADPNSLSIGNRATNSLAIASNSQRHPELTTIFAPGNPIVSARAGGGTRSLSGTSMSSPHVAGVAVLMQELAVQELGRRLTVDEFEFLVSTSGFDLALIPTTDIYYQSLDVLALGNAILAMKDSSVELAATSFDVSSGLQRGATGQANFTIANTGSSNSGNFDIDIYLSTNGTISERGDIWLGTTSMEVAAGATANGSLSFVLPAPSASIWNAGTQFTIGMIIDRENMIGESNEGNNLNQGALVDQEGVTIEIDTTPPAVLGVYANSTEWSSQFMATLGSVDGQLLDGVRTLPWDDVDRLVIQFSEAIDNFSTSLIELRNSAGVVATSIAYDSNTFRATLSLDQPLAFSKWRIAASDTLQDASGNVLDGDNTGGAGGLLNVRFDVVIGDATGDGRVNGTDLNGFGTTFNKLPGDIGFNPYANWNGDDRVNGSDLSAFALYFNQQIGTFSEPGAPFGAGGGGAGLASTISARSDSKSESRDDFFSAFGEEADKRRRRG